MPKFALKRNQFARGNVIVYNLIVLELDQFENFENSLEDIYKSQFRTIAAIIAQISENTKPLPHGKRRKLMGFKQASEMRTKDLRLYYLVLEDYGITVCLGGYKSTQKNDLQKLKSLQKELINYIKEHGNLEIKSR